TFIEPGIGGRFIFSREGATRILQYRKAILSLTDPQSRRLFLVLLGGILIEVSNVTVSGKGRRYRRNWLERNVDASEVDRAIHAKATAAIADIGEYGKRSCCEFQLLRGDARQRISEITNVDLAVFSPPYPNSFDYTDVYNVELWMLGYL